MTKGLGFILIFSTIKTFFKNIMTFFKNIKTFFKNIMTFFKNIVTFIMNFSSVPKGRHDCSKWFLFDFSPEGVT